MHLYLSVLSYVTWSCLSCKEALSPLSPPLLECLVLSWMPLAEVWAWTRCCGVCSGSTATSLHHLQMLTGASNPAFLSALPLLWLQKACLQISSWSSKYFGPEGMQLFPTESSSLNLKPGLPRWGKDPQLSSQPAASFNLLVPATSTSQETTCSAPTSVLPLSP